MLFSIILRLHVFWALSRGELIVSWPHTHTATDRNRMKSIISSVGISLARQACYSDLPTHLQRPPLQLSRHAIRKTTAAEHPSYRNLLYNPRNRLTTTTIWDDVTADRFDVCWQQRLYVRFMMWWLAVDLT